MHGISGTLATGQQEAADTEMTPRLLHAGLGRCKTSALDSGLCVLSPVEHEHSRGHSKTPAVAWVGYLAASSDLCPPDAQQAQREVTMLMIIDPEPQQQARWF